MYVQVVKISIHIVIGTLATSLTSSVAGGGPAQAMKVVSGWASRP